MTENEKYIFDLLGFIVVPNALTTEQITDMNALMDEQIEKECKQTSKVHTLP